MGIFSRRKDSKRTVEASETERRGSKTSVVEGPPVLRLNVSGSSLPEFESDTLRIAKSMPPPTQRPCLKRSSQSEGSIYLKMHAANNRLTQRASRNVHFGESTDPVSTSSSRSSSSTRSSKQVSFKIDNSEVLEHRKSQNVRYFQKATPLSIPTEDSDSEDFQDANSIASSISSRSSWTSGYSSSIRSTTPRPPTHVASGFERKMSKLPPVQIRDAQRRPKIALGHSKDGTPSWSLKTRPRSVAAH